LIESRLGGLWIEGLGQHRGASEGCGR
jgi:hypothetical protein